MTFTPQGEGEQAASAGKRDLAMVTAGIRQPVVVVLLLIAFFSAIAGKPLDGLLMLAVSVGLAWDAGRGPGPAAAGAGDASPPGLPEPGGTAFAAVPPGGAAPAAGATAALAGYERGPRSRARRRRRGALGGLLLVAGGLGYAVVVGSFVRYSWPATIAVVGLGACVVGIGWHGPVRQRPDPGSLPRLGTALWGAALVAGALCELWSLAHQPSLDTTSWAHPTISALTDPLLASHPGRSVLLVIWLLIGRYLVRR